jgi:hypothetical protein
VHGRKAGRPRVVPRSVGGRFSQLRNLDGTRVSGMASIARKERGFIG